MVFADGFEGRVVPRSEEDPDTELLTAAKTTLAKEMPEVEPKKRESDVPCTATLLACDKSLSTLSRPSCASVPDVTSAAERFWLSPLRLGVVALLTLDVDAKSSGGSKAMLFSFSSDSR